ncbi:MAG: rhomboid family intramembrane serine protease, partial [Acidimicrobiales bacterium]
MTPTVIAVIAVNVAVFLIEETNFNSIVDRFAMLPIEVHHQPYRLITAAFLHANVEHILFNMLALAIVGPSVEVVVGKARFLAIYLLAAM